MVYEDIKLAQVEDWLEVRINRPHKLNALRERTAEEILDCMHAGEHDRAIRAVIVAGEGKAFCTGIDTSEFEVSDNEYFDFYRKRGRSRKVNLLFRDLPKFTKPVISAIEGYALGGGLELALLGDLIVAGTDASFGLPEAKLGLMPGGGGTQTLPRLVGPAVAKELIWTGRRLSAEEARAYRLVNHVTPAGETIEKARELARAISRNAPLPIMFSKSAIQRGLDVSLSEGMAVENDVSFMLYYSEDRREGLNAFREKRAANFKGE